MTSAAYDRRIVSPNRSTGSESGAARDALRELCSTKATCVDTRLGLPTSVGCAMWVNGSETVVGARGEGDPDVLVHRPGKDAGGRQVRQGIAREAA
jgi:hypothetical protein